MNSILIGRKAFGLGDWIMSTSVIKMINRQYPDMRVYFDVTNVPPYYLQFLAYFNIEVTPVSRPCTEQYTYHIPHLIYDLGKINDPPKHLIMGMVDMFNNATLLNLKYEPEMLAKYIGPEFKISSILESPKPLILIANSGSKYNPRKEWGIDNFTVLAKHLKEKYDIAQIGLESDPPMNWRMYRFWNLALGELMYLMRKAEFVISLENGISHFAGHNAIPCYTLYIWPAVGSAQVWYPKQYAITAEDGKLDPEKVYEEITANETTNFN